MDHVFEPYKRTFRDIGPIVFSNVILLTNIIIYAVVVLLFVFHQTQAAIFLATAITIAIVIGIIQGVRARLTLEKLQLLTALKFLRINSNGTQEFVLAEQIEKDNRIKLKLGDQIPCDGVLISARGLEVNNALLTGESESFARGEGEKVQAGSIVTAGSGVLKVETTFADSRISQMTKNIKKYSTNHSPIQRSIDMIVKYTGYALLVIIVFVILRGTLVNDSVVRIVKNVGALASTLVPQGLVLATTILFAYGAINLLRRNVLLQEINATEKLGRIKNLCLDKTGTLTENVLVVQDLFVPAGVSKPEAQELAATYLRGSDDSSETVGAIRKFIGGDLKPKLAKAIPFSSSRQFGAVQSQSENSDIVILFGAPDVFLPHFAEEQKKWLGELLAKHAGDGKRLLCVARMTGLVLPENLSQAKLSLIAVFVFFNNLREGIADVISFFQDRGVSIRVISGDNPATVQAVANAAGVKNTTEIITGPEIEKWPEKDFDKNVSSYTIFARITPEQKEKIIQALKKSGFTAMVGDGANDALALKKADLGIAMFDGAPATRKLAAVVLMNNTFLALPDGVRLADNIIGHIEIMSSLFFNQTALGFLFFIIISLLGHAYPFTPLNITLIDYFTVGFPSALIFYWVLIPTTAEPRLATTESFLKRVLPFCIYSGVIQAIGAALVFILSPAYLKNADSNVLVALAFIIFGFMFFIFTPSVYRGTINRAQKLMLAGFGVFQIIALYVIFKIPFLLKFFDITYLSQVNILEMIILLVVFGTAQYLVARWFLKTKKFMVNS